MSFNEQVKTFGFRQFASAVRTFSKVLLCQMVNAKTMMTLLALLKGVCKASGSMSRRVPNPFLHQNTTIHFEDMVMKTKHVITPSFLDIPFQFRTQLSIVINARQSPVNF